MPRAGALRDEHLNGLTDELLAWQTKALLEPMGGVDDPVRRRITFQTGHLSGYAIAQ